MPGDSRIRLSEMPTFSLKSLGMEAWVIVEGWHASDSTPPRLSASVISFNDLKKVRKFYSPLSVKEIIAPPFFAWRWLTA